MRPPVRGLRLVAIGGEEGQFAAGSAAMILQRLVTVGEQRRFYWIGHDNKTRPLALELRALVSDSRAVSRARSVARTVLNGCDRVAASV